MLNLLFFIIRFLYIGFGMLYLSIGVACAFQISSYLKRSFGKKGYMSMALCALTWPAIFLPAMKAQIRLMNEM